MANKFASGKHAFGLCDICGQRYPLRLLKPLTINRKVANTRVCPDDWNPDHPQYRIGLLNMNDPQALKNARPDIGSDNFRSIEWGWNPLYGSTVTTSTGTLVVSTT